MSARPPAAATARRLARSFYARPCLTVAESLIGAWLVRRGDDGVVRAGRIVETEAYVGTEDQASHARRGPTPRARVMFGPPGHAYVYFIYGRYFCFNAVCEPEGEAAAVLVRALEPTDGVTGGTDGPGKLCDALRIGRGDNGVDLCDGASPLWIETRGRGARAPRVVATPRVGVDYAGEWAARPWRFVDADSPWLSRKLPRPT